MRLIAAAVALALTAAAGAAVPDRRVVVDPDEPPWTAVTKVQTNIGSKCTGVLIAPTTVLTAAHCLYNPRTQALLQPVSLHVLFGYERDGYRWHRLVRSVETGPGFDGHGGTPGADWAKLELAEAVPVAPLPLDDTTPVEGMKLTLAGYNQDRAQLLMADLDCHELYAQALSGGGIAIYHNCMGTRGTSGGPLLTQRDGKWRVAGINIHAGPDANMALHPALPK